MGQKAGKPKAVKIRRGRRKEEKMMTEGGALREDIIA